MSSTASRAPPPASTSSRWGPARASLGGAGTWTLSLTHEEAPIQHISAESVAGCAGEDVEVGAGSSVTLGGDCRFWGGLSVKYRWHRVEDSGYGRLSPPNPVQVTAQGEPNPVLSVGSHAPAGRAETWRLTVTSLNLGGSATDDVVVTAAPPGAPRNVQLSAPGGRRLQARWDQVVGADGCRVKWGEARQSGREAGQPRARPAAPALRTERVETPQYTTPDLSPGVAYAFEVSACSGDVCGAPAEEVQATVEVSGTPPTANAGPDLEALPGTTVTLQGRDSVNPHGKWHQLAHRWDQKEGPTVALSDATRGDPSFDVPEGTAIGTAYTFELTATDKDGESDTDTVTVPGGAPAVPVLTVGDPPSVTEGGPGGRTSLTFMLRLDRASTRTLSPLVQVLSHGDARYVRVDDPATADGGEGADVLGRARADREAAGPVTFAPGATEATLTLTVLGDAAFTQPVSVRRVRNSAILTPMASAPATRSCP